MGTDYASEALALEVSDMERDKTSESLALLPRASTNVASDSAALLRKQTCIPNIISVSQHVMIVLCN